MTDKVDAFRHWVLTHNRENYGRYDAFAAGAAWQREEWTPAMRVLRTMLDVAGLTEGVKVADAMLAKQVNSDPHASNGGCERSKDDIPASSVRAFDNQDGTSK